MQAKIDAMGRVVVPKPLRDALGLTAGSTVDISQYGDGLHLVASGRSARLVRDDDGLLVADSVTTVSDEVVFDLLDAGRR